ncbi:MAG TPA: ABC transporter ATP-binding protein [Candidatus Saccharimonadales bacterium]|nr:ABC transporter ATP-binding protein [Candidatus Saccharimonadales bacterium]
MTDTAVKADGIYKDFILPHEKKDSVKRVFTGVFKKNDSSKEVQHALRNVTFEVQDGEFFGIVGRNGSGKSTLLKMLAGIYQPSKGSVNIRGKLVPFIELGVGFNAELTGRENVYLNGALLGFSKKEIDSRYDEIVEFAELERFMDQKLKNYSSGMQVRLAFSVAIMAEADILLVDEVLAVGDASFQRKCFDYFRLLKKQKKTVVFVTHDMSAVREYCDRAMLIEKSRVVDIGSPHKIATQYTKLFNEPTKGRKVEQGKRWGDKRLEYTDISLNHELMIKNEQQLKIDVEAVAAETIEEPIMGFLIKNQSGQQLVGTNSLIKQQQPGVIKKGEKIKLTWVVDNVFSDGTYYVDVAINDRDGVTVCDWWEEAARFEVVNEERVPYPFNPPVVLEINKDSSASKRK